MPCRCYICETSRVYLLCRVVVSILALFLFHFPCDVVCEFPLLLLLSGVLF
eukprot:m.63310 g.63310  ORF g.63310 m.63310 type:complete len:51 (+) comp13440_c0_seq1:87-239(+)